MVSACVQAAASGHLIIPNEADKNDNGGKDCHNYPDADRKAPARLNRVIAVFKADTCCIGIVNFFRRVIFIDRQRNIAYIRMIWNGQRRSTQTEIFRIAAVYSRLIII